MGKYIQYFMYSIKITAAFPSFIRYAYKIIGNAICNQNIETWTFSCTVSRVQVWKKALKKEKI